MKTLTAFAVAVVAMSTLIASPAHAATRAGRYVYVASSISLAPGSIDSAVAYCPTGRAVGAGGAVSGSSWLERMQPSKRPLTSGDPDDGALAQAWNDGGRNVRLKAVAVCMRGPAADGLSYATSATTTPDPDPGASVVASCGTHLIGGGGGIDPDGGIDLTASTPAAPEEWHIDYGTSRSVGGKTLTIRTVCSRDGSLVSTIRSKSSTVGPNKIATIRVACPRGTHVTSGGVGTDTGLIRRSLPFDGADDDASPDDGWLGTVYNPRSTTKTYGVSAVCLR